MEANQEKTLSSETNYKITGFLRKRNRKNAMKLLRKWDKRWFALDDRNLIYASSPKDCIAKHSYSVKEIMEVRVVDESATKDKRFEFEVVVPGRILRLRPKSESQRGHWVAALQKSRAVAQGHDSNDGAPDAIVPKGQKLLLHSQKEKSKQGKQRPEKKHKSQLREFEAECERVVSARQTVTSTDTKAVKPAVKEPVREGLVTKAAMEQGWWGSALTGGYINDHPENRYNTTPRDDEASGSNSNGWTIEEPPLLPSTQRGGFTSASIPVIASSDWSTWDEDQVLELDNNEFSRVASPKRKELAGPRTPSPEHKSSKQKQQRVHSNAPLIVASKIYSNALFSQEEEDSNWGVSSSLRHQHSNKEAKVPMKEPVSDSSKLWVEDCWDSDEEIMV
mmetsp:Transcript_39751/g.55195  ORF Transcript_39751/g.55195 Transcript_39751/m.55195 type:complete len:392 (-) Transcript_39751:159-1334(-)|eukprot:CAMPEP_0196590402 /NCGR_PEP_ID=MMETSP1081-20130531/66539_1 /TAXON_ID=36882 /ORGANISM="Pyramimonas amylifera, Strain CCMP720" /LENGTH=391 /DNA_ID=CAMNT_0041913499 /DNA_START=268 /DNA_END=1443 /DNA_ORIENTATION=-